MALIRNPELIWVLGMAIYLVLMAEGFGLCTALGSDVIGGERFPVRLDTSHR